MIQKIYRERAGETKVFVEWLINTVCNYSCSYCPAILNDGSYKTPALELVEGFISQLAHNFAGKEIFINLLGGEPSYIKNLTDYLDVFKKHGIKTQLITNLSREQKWWEDNLDRIDSLMATFHMESADKKQFKKILRLCNERNFPLKIKILATPGRVKEALDIKNYIVEDESRYSIWLEEVQDHTRSFIDPGYTSKELFIISQAVESKDFDSQGVFDESLFLDEQGGEASLNSGKLIIKGQNHFKGWSCSAGINSLAINYDGNIYRGWCEVGKTEPIGNIADKSVLFPTEEIICPFQQCACGFDILTPKEKPSQPD
jgi:MoaA/NifB/PqqE/SkfB family radical SAM enzyme